MSEKNDENEVIKEPVKTVEKKAQPKCNIGNKMFVGILIGAGAVVILMIGGMTMKRVLDSRNFIGVTGMRGIGIERQFDQQDQAEATGRGMMGGRGRLLDENVQYNSNQYNNYLTGKVTAVNDKQFTATIDSETRIVEISDTTRFPNTSATKVVVGDTVFVSGEQDSSGIIQATRIVVNPTN